MLPAANRAAIRRWHRAADRLVRHAMQPKSRLTVSQWADQYRVVAEGTSSDPGRWHTSRTPYLRDIMDCFSDRTTRRIVFKKPSQFGATEAFLNVIGYFIHQDPCSIMVVQVSIEEAKKWSKEKLAPMIEATDVLQERVARIRTRDPDNAILSKRYDGGHIGIVGANSPAGFRQRSRRVVLFDDVDGFPVGGAGTEGDQITLGEGRAKTFWNRKVGYFSSPTLEDVSRIDQLFHEGDERYYHVRCPGCGCEQELLWLHDDGSYGLVCEHDAGGSPVPASARYACIGCGILIPETDKEPMVGAGRWIATKPSGDTASFAASSLISPYVRWSEIMEAFLRAKRSGSHLQMQGFVNTMVGDVYRDTGDQVEPHALQLRAEDYGLAPDDTPADVPQGVGLLTFGADVQGDRIEIVVWGWGAEERAWAIAWEQFDGDPQSDPAVWAALDAYLVRPFRHVSGAPVHLTIGGIDSGYATDKVYAFCEPRRHRGVWPVKGIEGRGRPIWVKPSPTKTSKAKTRMLVQYGTDSAKDSWLRSRLLVQASPDVPDPPAYVHFPTHLDRVFYEQLTSEKLVSKVTRGRSRRVWTLPEGRSNEVLDCSGIALGAMLSLGPTVIRRLGELADMLNQGQGMPLAPIRQRRVRSRGIDL